MGRRRDEAVVHHAAPAARHRARVRARRGRRRRGPESRAAAHRARYRAVGGEGRPARRSARAGALRVVRAGGRRVPRAGAARGDDLRPDPHGSRRLPPDGGAAMPAAGLPPREVLVAATRTGAGALGLDSTGTVTAGATADLLVLDADPLTDIKNVRRIALVVRRGEVYTRREIEYR